MPKLGRAALAAALALTSAAGPLRAATDPGTLDYALPADIDTLDPHWAYDALSLFVADQIYETLIDFTGGSLDTFEARVASVVPTRENGLLSPDGLRYAFPIRKGMKFHDGAPVTAEDVKYSLMRFLLLDREGGPSALLLPPILGVRSTVELDWKEAYARADQAIAVEGGAVVLRLRAPFTPLMGVLANFAHVVPKAYVAQNGGWDGRPETVVQHRNPAKEASPLFLRAIGSGPYKLVGWDRARNTVALERFDAYWRRPAPVARALLHAVPDPRRRRQLLETGETDVAWFDRRAMEGLKASPDIVIVDDLPALEAQNVFLFNFAAEPRDNPWLGSGRLGDGTPPDFFADADVRKGFAFAFDYDRFIKEGLHGKGVQAKGPIPAVLFGYNPRQQAYSYLPGQAEAAFKRARAGEVWARGFTLHLAVTEGAAERSTACRILKEGLEKLNPLFRVDCRAVTQSRMLDEFRARRLPCFIYRWVLDYPDPHNAVEPFLHSRGYFASQLGYNNFRADAAVVAAAIDPDPARRKFHYRELQAITYYDVPAIFTADSSNVIAHRAKVRGWLYHPIQPYGNLYEASKLR